MFKIIILFVTLLIAPLYSKELKNQNAQMVAVSTGFPYLAGLSLGFAKIKNNNKIDYSTDISAQTILLASSLNIGVAKHFNWFTLGARLHYTHVENIFFGNDINYLAPGIEAGVFTRHGVTKRLFQHTKIQGIYKGHINNGIEVIPDISIRVGFIF